MDLSNYIIIIIAFVFICGCIRFLYLRSFTNKQNINSFFKSALKAIIFIPIFLQGLQLLLCSIYYFFKFTGSFYTLIEVAIKLEINADSFSDFYELFILLCVSIIFLSNVVLYKIINDFNNNILKGISLILLFVLSFLFLRYAVFLFRFFDDDLKALLLILPLFVLCSLIFIGLFVLYRLKQNNYLKYYILLFKSLAAYCISFATIATTFFLVNALLWLIFSMPFVDTIFAAGAKTIPFVPILFTLIFMILKIVKANKLWVKILCFLILTIPTTITIVTNFPILNIIEFLIYIYACHLTACYYVACILAFASPSINNNFKTTSKCLPK